MVVVIVLVVVSFFCLINKTQQRLLLFFFILVLSLKLPKQLLQPRAAFFCWRDSPQQLAQTYHAMQPRGCPELAAQYRTIVELHLPKRNPRRRGLEPEISRARVAMSRSEAPKATAVCLPEPLFYSKVWGSAFLQQGLGGCQCSVMFCYVLFDVLGGWKPCVRRTQLS